MPLVIYTPIQVHTNRQKRMEGNILFNDALNTFDFMLIWYRTYGKGHSDNEKKSAAWATVSH